MFNTDSLRRALARATRDRRKQLGLTQDELGGRCGIHRNYIGLIEQARVTPTIRTIFRLAVGLGCSPADVMARMQACLDELEPEAAL